jgi:rubrerythrin
MPETIDVQEALRSAVQTEKDARDFYRFGAEKMAEDRAKGVFELLAREEEQHALQFYNVYPGQDLPDFEVFIAAPPNTESSWWLALKQAMLADFDERKALEMAMEQELALEKNLRETAARMNHPEIKAVYLANANSTHHHYQLIEEEYKAMLGMSG